MDLAREGNINQNQGHLLAYDLNGNRVSDSHTESAQAHIFRQQRTPLKHISDALQTGWAVASRSRDFTIEISN